MHTFLDSKAMARALRSALADHGIAIPLALSLELVAKQFGLDDWNTLAARIDAAKPDALPRGWHAYHSAAYPLHRLGVDPEDHGIFTLVSASSADVIGKNFATAMRSIDAAPWRGRAIRLRVELRGEDVATGTIWLRVDAARPTGTLRFDNLMQRETVGALQGGFGWTERSIVLDVPDDAATIHYGPMLEGVGQLWARRLRLEAAA